MPVCKKTDNILIALLIVIATVWNGFSANVMEQFIHMRTPVQIIGAIFRWAGMTSFIILPAALLYNDPRCKFLAKYIILPVILLGVIFSKPYFLAHKPHIPDIISYIFWNLSTLAGCIYFIFIEKNDTSIENTTSDHPSAQSITVLFTLLFLGVAPLNLFMQFPKLMHIDALTFRLFGFWHIFAILLTVAATVIIAYLLRKKSQEDRFLSMFFLSATLFFQLSVRFSFVRLRPYQTATNIVGALPLYVCSFGIMLLPFAIISLSNFFRSVLFLINTPGAIIAFVWPSTGVSPIFHYNVTCFVFTHVLLFAITANLVLSLNVKPQLYHLKHLAYLIVLYYFVMLLLNTLAINLDKTNYDPNFSFVSKSPLPIPLHNLLKLKIGVLHFSPLYILVLCVIQYALAWITFAVYKLAANRFSKKEKTTLTENID